MMESNLQLTHHALQNDSEAGSSETSINWFEYPVEAYPHHTDYAGIVWHGTYISWLEEARVAYLRSLGVSFADLVAIGCDLPVVEMAMRYHRPIRLGMQAIVKTRMLETLGVRIVWDYKIQSLDYQTTFASGQVTLVTVDREKGRIMRQIPPEIQNALVKIT